MIQIDGGKTTFKPGETFHGTISWETEPQPRAAELRLFWYTSGRGTRDVGIVETQQLQLTNPTPFTFTLPAGPYSLTGQLITITWAIELILKPLSQLERIEFSMSPNGTPVTLSPAPG